MGRGEHEAQADPAAVDAARAALEAAGVTGDGGWRVARVERLAERTLGLWLARQDGAGEESAGEGGGVMLSWAAHDGEPGRAFRSGPRFSAGYQPRPGAWTPGDPAAPPGLLEAVGRACEALVAIEAAVDLRPTRPDEVLAPDEDADCPPLPPPPAPARLPDDPVEALVACLAAGLEAELGTPRLPNPEGWVLDGVHLQRAWRAVADVRLRRPDRSLGFYVYPRDPDREAFARTRRYDVIYYSDDLPAARHHAELYARDRPTVDRVAGWIRRWDARGGVPVR